MFRIQCLAWHCVVVCAVFILNVQIVLDQFVQIHVYVVFVKSCHVKLQRKKVSFASYSPWIVIVFILRLVVR